MSSNVCTYASTASVLKCRKQSLLSSSSLALSSQKLSFVSPFSHTLNLTSRINNYNHKNKNKHKMVVKCQDASLAIPEDHDDWMFDQSQLLGPDVWNKTWYPKAADHMNSEKMWYVVDATDKILGRLASTIAIHIRGKNLATYTPSVDMGAYVIVVNADKVAVSGKKRTQKLYRRHSGRPGGMKVETFAQLQQRIPERIIEHAVRGMLPKGRLGRRLFTHLKVYKGPSHPHEAQQPIPLPIRDKRIQVER